MNTINHLYPPINVHVTGQILNNFQNLHLKMKYWFGQVGKVVSLILFGPILLVLRLIDGDIAKKNLLFLQNFSSRVRYLFGQIGYVISLTLFSPILLVLWLTLKLANYFYSKSLDDLKNNLSKANIDNLLNLYVDIRTAYNRVDRSLSEVKHISNHLVKASESDFLSKMFSTEILRYLSLGQEYLNLIDNTLSKLDEDALKGTFFQLTTENELWQNRNKIYQYKI